MSKRQKFRMEQEDLDALMAAMKPVPMIMLQCGWPPSQQEMANNAWDKLGEKMGFKHMTVLPDGGRDPRNFTAEISDDKDDKLQAKEPR